MLFRSTHPRSPLLTRSKREKKAKKKRKQSKLLNHGAKVNPSRTHTFLLASLPGVLASSLGIVSRSARTRSVGVRCFVLKKFMLALLYMQMQRWSRRKAGVRRRTLLRSIYTCAKKPRSLQFLFKVKYDSEKARALDAIPTTQDDRWNRDQIKAYS